MCMPVDPFSLFGGVLGLVRSATAFDRSNADRKAAQRMAENDAAMTEHQARLKEHQMRLNSYDADKAKREAARKYAAGDGNARSLLAARGVELDTGSALDVLVDSARRRAEDLFAVEDEAERANNGLAHEASLLRSRAKTQAMAARDRRSGLERGFDSFDYFAPSINSVGSLFSK